MRPGFMSAVADEYSRIRDYHAKGKEQDKFITLEAARRNAFHTDWKSMDIIQPSFTGVRTFNSYHLGEIAGYIDWTPFFHSWEMKGSYPKILQDPLRGEEARKLFADAEKMLQRIISEKWLTANAVVGIFPANSTEDDDILVYDNDKRDHVRCRFHTIRQQTLKPEGQWNMALSDFVAPAPYKDYVGCFALTTGTGIDEWVKRFEADHDDYHAIMLKALADRLAEAFAELMHLKIRKELWGYAMDENLSGTDLIAEKYQGIRPAPGYPAQPDHTEKLTIFSLLDAEKNTGIHLTESLAMVPTAAVSGLYMAHPAATYFGTGKINREQVEDYAERKGWTVQQAEKWLGTVIR
jgi:5-methyltetrahydrofolate--homocysteine methyltransferase